MRLSRVNIMQSQIELIPSDELVNQVRAEVDDLILYFSCGKDSLALGRKKGQKSQIMFTSFKKILLA